MQHLVDMAQLVPLMPMDVPNPGGGTAPPGFDKFTTVLGWGKWIALGVLVMALIGAGVMMGVGNRRGEGSEHVSRLAWVMGGVIVVAGAFTIVSFLVGS